MGRHSKDLQPNLPLDDELVEDWKIVSTFRTKPLSDEEIFAIIRRDAESKRDQELFMMSSDSEKCTTTLRTLDSVTGTQADVLKITVTRYKYILGHMATAHRLIVARMNISSVVQGILEPYRFDLYPVLDHEFESDELPMTKAQWDFMDTASDPLTLDVTSHAQQFLG